MKALAGLITLIFLVHFSTDLDSIRSSYFSGPKTEETAKSFNEMMETVDASTAILKAYKGASFALQAQYGQGIKEKKEFFELAVSNIEAAVQEDPDNPEIRLIRLSVQENSPRIVKYKDNMEDDKSLILEGFDSLTEAVKKCIRDYATHSDFFSEEEKAQLLN